MSPPSSPTAPERVARVVSLVEVAPRHYKLTLQQPSIAEAARPGQFVHILCRDGGQLDPFLRRAFSVMTTQEDCYTILFRVEGKGTAWLSQLHAGDEIDVLGPLGNGFEILGNTPFQPVLVGGGVGVPPLVSLVNQLFSEKHRPARAFIGARSGADLIGLEDMALAGAKVEVATEDGSHGYSGRVTEPLKAYLDAYPAEDPRPVVYSCGPYPMLKAVALICLSRGVPCQVSLEENMPCGVGLCNGCVVAASPSRCENNDFDRYLRICVSGPAIWAQDIDWGQG